MSSRRPSAASCATDGQARRLGLGRRLSDGSPAADLTSAAYDAAVAALFARTTHGVRLGLDRVRAMLRELGDPHQRLRTFHVAGTNGKGSTCATLDALLRAQGWRVGRYTSPHLVAFTERIVIDGVAMRRDAVVAWLDGTAR